MLPSFLQLWYVKSGGIGGFGAPVWYIGGTYRCRRSKVLCLVPFSGSSLFQLLQDA